METINQENGCCGGQSCQTQSTDADVVATAGASCQATSSQTYVPRFDIWNDKDKVILQGDLPGVAPDGLDIQFDDGSLTIVGKVDRPSPTKGTILSEYGVGDFRRSFRVHHDVDADAISAKLDGGVLTVELPTSEKAKPRKIAVNVSA